jgi:hypothetical protein
MTASPSPQAQAQQAQGLTDERIDEIQRAWIREGGSGPRGFARAIERELRASTAAAPSPVPAGESR